MTDQWSAGSLLVARPALRDPNFLRTVVFLVSADEDGALGVVLNRPTEVELAGALPGWSDRVTPPDRLFAGGPVSPQAAICLGRHDGAEPVAGFAQVHGPIGVLDLSADPALLPAGIDGLRVFAGYAGWDAAQLAGEIAEGAWYVVGSLPGDPFSPAPERLWRDVLRRQPGELAWVANAPLDPTLN